MARVNVQLRRNDFGTLAQQLPKRRDVVVRKTAFDILADAQEHAAVDTSAMRNSGYVVTNHDSSYAEAEAAARAANPDVALLPALPAPREGAAVIAFSAAYSLLVEKGTIKMPARPYLGPAVERQRAPFHQAIEALWRLR